VFEYATEGDKTIPKIVPLQNDNADSCANKGVPVSNEIQKVIHAKPRMAQGKDWQAEHFLSHPTSSSKVFCKRLERLGSNGAFMKPFKPIKIFNCFDCLANSVGIGAMSNLQCAQNRRSERTQPAFEFELISDGQRLGLKICSIHFCDALPKFWDVAFTV
jgi:hypothetical protein